MNLKSRKLTAAITIFALIVSSFWATSTEVLADALKTEMVVLEHHSTDMQVFQSHFHNQNQSTSGQTCNHGCHSASYLLGLLQADTTAVNPQLVIQVMSLWPDSLRDSPFLQGPFRPPLLLPLV